MTEIVFASNNDHKLQELRSMLPERVHLIGMKEAGIEVNIPETGATLTENAILKAKFLINLGYNTVLADDTGLEVEALGGAPGVYSARYAGPEANASKNIEKVLTALSGKEQRQARFVTVLCFIRGTEISIFRGEVHGVIAKKPEGHYGFGYDPIFIPEGFNKTFAQMNPEEKNSISHRKRALEKFIDHLQNVFL
ncbi:MAG: RdgB/HAM1 family non-canonical purine NTP pyrophosphatase [Thermaurantimonas sp.]